MKRAVIALAGLAVGAFLYRELPGMKRYWNIKQM